MSAYTRREFTKLALSGVAALSTTKALRAAEVPGRPNSKVAGVQIGLNVPYSFANPLMSGDDIIKNCVALGMSGLELRTHLDFCARGAAGRFLLDLRLDQFALSRPRVARNHPAFRSRDVT